MNKIDRAFLKTGKSRNYIITILLKRAMVDKQKLLKLNKIVKYQKRDPLKQWHHFHVRYREDMYEFCQDMRKFYKLSISRILAFSVGKYLDKIINELINKNLVKNTDNLYDVTPVKHLQSGYTYPPLNVNLKDRETLTRRLTRLIFAYWLTHDNNFVGSCLNLSSRISNEAALNTAL